MSQGSALLHQPKFLDLPKSPGEVRSSDFGGLIDLAAELGDKPVMVPGPAKRRAAIDGATPDKRRSDRLTASPNLRPCRESERHDMAGAARAAPAQHRHRACRNGKYRSRGE